MHSIARPSATAGLALAASSLIAVTPVASPHNLPRVVSADVRLVDASGGLLGDLGNLGGFSSLLGDAGGSFNGLFGDGSILNIPYNIFADIGNIPYTESLALQEYAYALGPAGSTGGVEGWIPPGATVGDGGVSSGDLYTMGGTGSWWMESMGNTWGWDNGNWPQLDAIMHFILPLQWTEQLAESVQSVAQNSFIDGSAGNCEFECSNVLGYLGGWLTGLLHAFDGTYPVTQTDTIGSDGASSFWFPDGVDNGSTDTAIWSGQPAINPILNVIEGVWHNAIESPASNPIHLPVDVLPSLALLGKDLITDFNPFIQGSFLYWGADHLYSIPSVIGGLVHSLTLGIIPNEFANLPGNGAEPIGGYSENITNLLPNLEEGFKYLADGLLGYVGIHPADATTATDASTLLGSLGDSSTLVPNLGTDLTASLDPSSLGAGAGSAATSAAEASVLGELTSLWPALGSDFATMFPNLASDISTWFPELAAALAF